TITPGFAYCDLDDARIGFVDVPGHHQFIHNMLSGIAGIDAVLVVVAADEGIMPQTVEHVRIMDLLGIDRAVLVISKIDRTDPELLTILESELETFVRGTCLEHAPLVHTAVPAGDGIDELRRQLRNMAAKLPERRAAGNFRLAIDRAFTLKGIGVVVTGFVHAGQVQRNDDLVIVPDEIPVRLRGIFSDDQAATVASVGHRCALNLGGVDLERTRRGQWLTTNDASFGTTRVDVRLNASTDAKRPLLHWTPVHIFHGASHVTGRVVLSEDRQLTPGETQLAQLVLDHPIVAMRGDICILRNQASDQTLAGAVIVDIFASRRGRKLPSRIKQLRRMENSNPHDCLQALIHDTNDGVVLERFRLNWNLTPAEAKTLYGRIDAVLIDTGDGILGFDPGKWTTLRGDILFRITEWHRDRPNSAGIRLNELRDALSRKISSTVLKAALDSLVQNAEITQAGPAYHLPAFRANMLDADAARWKIVHARIKDAGMRPPTVEELAESCHMEVQLTRSLLLQAEKLKLVTRLEPNRFFLPDTLQQLAHRLAKLAENSTDGRVTAADYRDQSGLGRNLTIKVLEHFDAIQLTRRIGDSRCLIKPVDVVFENQRVAINSDSLI
ncbi:MAG: selenocysteine-specific translation elongation factor, partial [Gammaproteobacteria bacterium]|nr:selenocysteine-specific translation elongation factor [Gammaproteobacteria bacterium]